MAAAASLMLLGPTATCFVTPSRQRTESGVAYRVVVSSRDRRWESYEIDSREDAERAAQVLAEFCGASVE